MSLSPPEELHAPLTVFEHDDDPFAALAEASPPLAAHPREAIVPLGAPRTFQQAYGLESNPFQDSVNPKFFYRTPSHAEAFRLLTLATEYETSLSLLTAPSGMGKTLVSQLLLEQLDPERYCAALVLVTPGLSRGGLLREILSELSVGLPVGATRVQDLVKILSHHIMELQAEGRRLVLIIDESHLLSADGLHIVRTISNIETPERKLVTCLLIGEERLAARLEHASYESLRNRIFLRGTLPPLSEEETAQYIKFRLMTSGRLDELYTPAALTALHAATGGICRSLNKLGLLTLIEAAAQGRPVIDETLVAACAARM
jgi:type II secretory pathway predicted ATPase ExeA